MHVHDRSSCFFFWTCYSILFLIHRFFTTIHQYFVIRKIQSIQFNYANQLSRILYTNSKYLNLSQSLFIYLTRNQNFTTFMAGTFTVTEHNHRFIFFHVFVLFFQFFPFYAAYLQNSHSSNIVQCLNFTAKHAQT